MKRQSRKNQRRIVASVLTGLFFVQQTMTLSVLGASTITGIADGNSGTFNISPTGHRGNIGYRGYTDFTVGSGDVANLEFKHDGTNLETFVNMVTNQININGIVNSVRDNSFYNGKAVFVSPNGMVVGSSGVLNVGALGAYTSNLSNENFQQLADNLQYQTDETIASFANGSGLTYGSGPITINGKIITTGDANIKTAGKVTLGSNGGVVAGVNESQRAVYTSNDAANQLFNNLVNVDNIKSTAGNQFVSDAGGTVNIVSYGGGIDLGGNVVNYGKNGTTSIINNTYDTTPDNFGNLEVSGNVMNKSGQVIIKNAAGNLTLTSDSNVYNNGATEITNETDTRVISDTNNGLYLNGRVDNNGTLFIQNTGEKGLNVASTANITNNGGDILVLNGYGDGNHGTTQTTLTNISNNTGGMNVAGNIKTTNGNAVFYNTEKGVDGMNFTAGSVDIGGTSEYYNDGAAGLNVTNSTVHSDGNLTMVNTGTYGLNVNSTGRVTSDNNIALTNTGTGHLVSTFQNSGMNVQGLVNAAGNVQMTNSNSNVVMGDTTANQDNYVTAGGNITINNTSGSILNYGVEKVLVKADGDLTMTTTDGTIGLPVKQGKCSGTNCTGIGVKSDNSRDFTKSVNGNIKGKVRATTTDVAGNNEDYVINYAAIASDMNIDAMKADGRVILTVDDDYGTSNSEITGKRYNMLNARIPSNTEANANSDTNIEGWGISLIADGSIGTADNKVTFIQNKAANYSMDALANKNIYLKENSFNDSDYGRTKEIPNNEVCSMVAREGDLDVEFGGNTKIKNITSEGDLKVVTRGQTMEIENLGHVNDPALKDSNGAYIDYFGTYTNGEADGGFLEDARKTEILPNNAVVKALDINHNVRPTDTTVKNPEVDDGDFEAWAGSTVKVSNGLLDKGTLDITADNIYANGIEAHFNKDGFSKAPNDTTQPIEGVYVEGGPNIPTGHAVRPDDVEDTNRDVYERNYYYPEGDGDNTFNGEPSNVDDNDDIVDATPLAMPDEGDTDIDTDVDTDIDNDIDLDTDTDIDLDSDTDLDNDTDTDTDLDTDTDTDIDEIEIEGDTDTDTDIDTDIDNDTDIDTDTDVDLDSDTDLDIDTDTDTDLDTDTDTDIDEIEIEGDTDTDTDIDTDIDNDTDIDTDTDIDIDADSDNDTDLDNDTDTDTDLDTDTDTDIDTPEKDIVPPKPEPTPTPPDVDGRFSYIKIDDNSVEAIDKRQYMRFNVFDNAQPITMERSNNGINALLDISRGGIAVKADDNVHIGDIVPVHITYGDIDIKADVKIVSKSNDRAGAQFVDLDEATANQLLYLSMILEGRPNITFK